MGKTKEFLDHISAAELEDLEELIKAFELEYDDSK
jgi:hypothetical protein